MDFENSLLAKLFEGVLEGRSVEFKTDLLPVAEVQKAIALLPISLSSKQKQAVSRAWTHEVSYIQGPPGTGKSHTITAIMLAALFLKKRVLLVSHKKPAIDVVFDRLKECLGEGSVIYASNDVAQRQAMRGTLQSWLDRGDNLQSYAELDALRRVRSEYRGKVEQLKAEVEKLEGSIRSALQRERDFFHRQERFHKNRTAYLTRFETLGGDLNLSLSADVDLANALLPEIELQLGDELHANDGRMSRSETLRLRRFFVGFARHFFADHKRLEPGLAATNYVREHLDLTCEFQSASVARSQVNPDFLRATRTTLAKKQHQLEVQRAALAKAHFEAHVVGKLRETADDVRKFAGMIRHANPALIAEKMEAILFPKVIETLPLWVGQMRHLGEFLPFDEDLFDLIIVDEASQVNIAEIIPAFYRGKRICVVGDDKQLGLNAAGVNFGFGGQFEELIWHKHFNGSGALYSQAGEHSLLVSKHSILDFICSMDDGKVPKTTLDEHFRSFPQLASFTSEAFYKADGGLRLMKEVPKNLSLECFNSVEVGGVRDEKTKTVANEIEELLRWLTKLIRGRHYEHDPALRAHGFTHEHPPTLGVISFLTKQRDAIRERVEEVFSPDEIRNSHLMIGTPEDFQGNERDIIFITLGLDGTSRWGKGHYENPNRFNVATSRAIHYTLLIYGGIPANARLIKSYLGHFGKSWRSRTPEEVANAASANGTPRIGGYRWDWNRKLHRELCESEFEHRVADVLERFVEDHAGKAKLRLFNQVQASRALGVSSCGQKRLDFVVLNEGNGVSVAVEVDGRDHFTEDGRSYSEAHLERVDVLRRAGWRIIHIPYYLWWRDGWLDDTADPEFSRAVSELFSDLREALELPRKGRNGS